MKRIITYSIIALLQASVALAQTSVSLAQTPSKPKLQKREKYEWQGEIPTYVETLKKELTYPMAWGNSPIKNFKKWKKAARAKVFECMMTPPKAAAAWNMEVLGEEQRDGYKAQKIAFNINAYSRITAYLLIPDGKGPFPTVNALHDHGAHLFIGKEKMIRPFFTPEEKDAPEKQAPVRRFLMMQMRGQNSFTIISMWAITWRSMATWSFLQMLRCGEKEAGRKAWIETNTISLPATS